MSKMTLRAEDGTKHAILDVIEAEVLPPDQAVDGTGAWLSVVVMGGWVTLIDPTAVGHFGVGTWAETSVGFAGSVSRREGCRILLVPRNE